MARQLKHGLDILHDLQLISHLDYYFAKSMEKAFPNDPPLTIIFCALVSRALSQGHICLNLDKDSGTFVHFSENLEENILFASHDDWIKELNNSTMVGRGSGPKTSPVSGNFPLVLDSDNNLYFSKYYDLQMQLVENLRARLGSACFPMNLEFIDTHLAKIFKNQDHAGLQKEAVKKALTHNFVVISGGPGTGKTYITNIIRSLVQLYASKENLPSPRIISVAPTGKAASRLKNGATIHSVLKPLKNGSGFFHCRDNPVLADIVIIDEASMIDLALMARLLDAVSPTARVIMLGDENQLSPVQAGAVFNDICRVRGFEPYLVFLEYNFRSKGKTGLENLSRAINKNDFKDLKSILTSKEYPDLVFEDTGKISCPDKVAEKYIVQGYQKFMLQDDLEKSLDELDRFRILCAHNKGPSGTLQINNVCEKILHTQTNFDIREKFFKRIIMIGSNDYDRGLFNGDTGVVYHENSVIKAGFRMSDTSIRQFRYHDIPAHDTAFAVTIHKSQGSEFDSVLIIIPEKLSPIVTRQLLYTGVTRAREKAIIIGSLDVLGEAMALSPEKSSNVTGLLELAIAKE